MRSFAVLCSLYLTACLPTLHNARVEPGFRLDAGLTLLQDQPRERAAQRSDGLVTVAPVYGFRDRFEIGLPIGVYWEDGPGISNPFTSTSGQQLVALPYLKAALLPSGGRDHLSVFLQAAYFVPASIGIRYGRDLGRWEPHVGLGMLFSAGPAGDSPVVSRYQQGHQSLLLGSIGATVFARGRPAIEAGVLRNSYIERNFSTGEPVDTRYTFYDLFVGIRLGTSR